MNDLKRVNLFTVALKLNRIIDSCETIGQYNASLNLLDKYYYDFKEVGCLDMIVDIFESRKKLLERNHVRK